MASQSIPGPIVRQPSSPTLVGTRERRAKMGTSFEEERQPSIQVMDRLEHSIDEDQEESSEKKKRKTKRNSIRIIITRVFSAILVIADCVSDWLQYFEIIIPGLNEAKSDFEIIIPGLNEAKSDFERSFRSSPQASNQTCTSKSDVGDQFMYFTIAGTGGSLIQLANIIFQIYSEVEYLKKKKNKQFSEDNDGTPKKLLDGRTETLYSLLFIEIPQGILLMKYQDACLPSLSLKASKKYKRRVKQRIYAVVNGGIALLNNAFRYITCSKCCEEDIEDTTCGWCRVAIGKYIECFRCVVCSGSSKAKSKKPCGKCGGKCGGILPCFFPCLCFFFRYESPMLCGICGKKCVIDKCKCSTEPWSYKLSLCGFCYCHYCPLINPDDPEGGGQKCCDVTSGLCKCSDGTCFDGTIGCCDSSIGKCCDATGLSCNSSDGKCAVTIGCCEWSTGNCRTGKGTCLKCPERKPREPSDGCKCFDGKGCDDPSECFKSSYGKCCGGSDDLMKCSNACSNPFDYEPLACNVRLALIVNYGYLVLYFHIVFRMLFVFF
ncbi:uncharacterized protein [Mytilus edulis]|uniref:uncharacterized protein n=1 Tax=Mytilus edulis TaxID=6550 RepID=UPI0039EE29C6